MMNEQGLLTIYTLENVAPKGLKPVQKLVEVTKAYYQERTVGVTRLYAAKGVDARIDALVRCFTTEVIPDGAVVIPEDGTQYQVDAQQKIIGKDANDLTLVKVEKTYEIYTSDFN